MKHLLDTHVVIRWFFSGRELERAHARVIERGERFGTRFGVSSLTLWEIATLVAADRIDLPLGVDESLDQVESSEMIEILPLDARIAIDSTRLGARFHADPIDRIITATARCHHLTLLTSDRNIIDSGVVDVI